MWSFTAFQHVNCEHTTYESNLSHWVEQLCLHKSSCSEYVHPIGHHSCHETFEVFAQCYDRATVHMYHIYDVIIIGQGATFSLTCEM